MVSAGSAGALDMREIRRAARLGLLVCQAANNRIAKFSPTGAWITSWGTEGGKPGQFRRPYGATLDSDNNVWVADNTNHRIQEIGRCRSTRRSTGRTPRPTSTLFLTPPGTSTAIGWAASSSAKPAQLSFQPLVTGTYKLRVKAASGASDFTLGVSYGG